MAAYDDSGIASIPGVCEVSYWGDPTASRQVLIEVPHGATQKEHYDLLRARLTSPIDADMIDFFFVNTDFAAPECAAATAGRLTTEGAAVLLVRSLIPRTFIDCNRRSAADASSATRSEMTPLIPSYITADEDRCLLLGMHATYRDTVRRAFDRIVGAGGSALILHTYAPRSIDVSVDESIVEALHRAYEPAVYAGWPERPEVDMITEAGDGTMLASPALASAMQRELEAAGFEVRRNATYRLFPSTAAYEHCSRYPGRVLCIEFSRGKLADPFIPFSAMKVCETQVDRAASAMARAFLLQNATKEKI